MRKTLAFMICVLPLQSFAMSNIEIVDYVTNNSIDKFFPSGVKVESISDVNFFPDYEDSKYARFGNVCGKVSLLSGEKKINLVFISHITEKSNNLLVEPPVLYDLSKQGEIAREDLKKRCK